MKHTLQPFLEISPLPQDHWDSRLSMSFKAQSYVEFTYLVLYRMYGQSFGITTESRLTGWCSLAYHSHYIESNIVSWPRMAYLFPISFLYIAYLQSALFRETVRVLLTVTGIGRYSEELI